MYNLFHSFPDEGGGDTSISTAAATVVVDAEREKKQKLKDLVDSIPSSKLVLCVHAYNTHVYIKLHECIIS